MEACSSKSHFAVRMKASEPPASAGAELRSCTGLRWSPLSTAGFSDEDDAEGGDEEEDEDDAHTEDGAEGAVTFRDGKCWDQTECEAGEQSIGIKIFLFFLGCSLS